MIVLGIETSCDECAIALVQDGKTILSNVIATQVKDHAPYFRSSTRDSQPPPRELDPKGLMNKP
jgi:hypothetical protein